MKKKLLALSCLMMAGVSAFGSCAILGGGGNSAGNSDQSSNSAAAGKKTIKAVRTDIEGFDTDFLPVSDIERKQGKIDVALVFEDTLAGWEALAAEYERLHDGEVSVVLDNGATDASAYQTNLSYEIQDENSDWDIVQGNLFQTNGLSTYCINMYNAVNSENGYAGAENNQVRYWEEVLEEDAYLTDKSGSNNSTYIMNTEGLQTAWFVNTVALDAAKAKGYTGADVPATWDELMSLCYYMEEAGYNNPLGIALDNDSLGASQFTWLLRVYGDYYYRNEYINIMLGEYQYNKTSENPESATGYSVSANKFFYSLFANKDATYYVGPRSDKFKEFLGQFEKMKPYLRSAATDSTQSGLSVLRTKFATQSEGKSSPQLFLDYAGAGLKFKASETADFKVDFFDYPVMVSDGGFIPENTLLRDVGGNGGYLSILKHDDKQNALNLDFIKFVASPYGQSIYYEALSENGKVPMGMTTVVNDYVAIPQSWVEFFQTDKIKFNGLVDGNPYISHLIRGFADGPATTEQGLASWKKYLTSDSYATQDFVVDWTNAMNSDWTWYCNSYGKDASLRDSREGTTTL